jgi:hypothetical protein
MPKQNSARSAQRLSSRRRGAARDWRHARLLRRAGGHLRLCSRGCSLLTAANGGVANGIGPLADFEISRVWALVDVAPGG